MCQKRQGAGNNNNQVVRIGRPPNKAKQQKQRQQQQQPSPRGTGEKKLRLGSGTTTTTTTTTKTDNDNNNNSNATTTDQEEAAILAIREMAALLVVAPPNDYQGVPTTNDDDPQKQKKEGRNKTLSRKVTTDRAAPTKSKSQSFHEVTVLQSTPSDRGESSQEHFAANNKGNKKSTSPLDSTSSLGDALKDAMLKDDDDHSDESSVTSATSATSSAGSSATSLTGNQIGHEKGTEDNHRPLSPPQFTKMTTEGEGVGNNNDNPNPAVLALAELQAKYNQLLSTSKIAIQGSAAKVSKLEGQLKAALRTKDQELVSANATILSLRGRVTALKDDVTTVSAEKNDLAKKLAAIDPINYNPIFNDPTTTNITNDNNHNTSLPHHLSPMNNSMPVDVSNCSSEEAHHKKMEEIMNERDSAEEQVKELITVQLQKDELLLQLQRIQDRLNQSEMMRVRDKKECEEREKNACDETLMQRRRIVQLESLMEVIVGQRDRTSSRVRQLLLGGEGPRRASSRGVDGSGSSEEDDNYDQLEVDIGTTRRPNSRALGKVLASFKSENEHLATEAKECKANVAILQSEKDDAMKQSTRLQVSVDELRSQVDTLQSQNIKLQQEGQNSFERNGCCSYQSDHDECLRVLENVNITNSSIEDSLAHSPDRSVNESLSGESVEPLPADIMSPPTPPSLEGAAAITLPNTAAASQGSSPPSMTMDADETTSGEDKAIIRNVPSLAEAQAEEDEENKLEELTNALDSLNEFEDFILELGLEV